MIFFCKTRQQVRELNAKYKTSGKVKTKIVDNGKDCEKRHGVKIIGKL